MNLNKRDWSLRATVTPGDAKTASFHIGVLPAAKTRIQQTVDSWKLGIKPEGEMVPTLQTWVAEKGPGQEGWSDRWCIKLQILPQEVEGEGVGLGILPILNMAMDDNLVPGRTDIAKEMMALWSTFKARCTWKRANTTKLASFVAAEGETNPASKPTKKQLKEQMGKYTVVWPDLVSKPQTGKRKGETRIEPVEVRKEKYSSEGRFLVGNINELGLPEDMQKMLVNMANCSLARSTWKAYSTAERAAERCEKELNVALNMPWGVREALVFTAWCIQRNLASSTMKQYMSGIRQAHKRENMAVEAWENHILKAVIKGRERTETPKKQKVAMTPGLLLEIKRHIIGSSLTYVDKCSIWALCTMMYSGSLRGGEILGEEESTFDSRNIMMESDVRIKSLRLVDGRRVKMVCCTIRNPKELPGTKEVEVEMFQTRNKFCPVQAVEKLKDARRNNEGRPFATRASGRIITKAYLNKFIKEALVKMVDYEEWTVSSHSFRAGLATGMARAGYSDEEIKRQGRWRSDAFLQYIRLGRAQRLEQQMKLSEELAQIAESENKELRASRRRSGN